MPPGSRTPLSMVETVATCVCGLSVIRHKERAEGDYDLALITTQGGLEYKDYGGSASIPRPVCPGVEGCLWRKEGHLA